MTDRPLDPIRFRNRRATVGLTQVQLAAKAGVSVSFVKLIERGKTNPSRPFRLVLARALKCKVDDLIEDVDPEREAGVA